jgi:hypothetical protein
MKEYKWANGEEIPDNYWEYDEPYTKPVLSRAIAQSW